MYVKMLNGIINFKLFYLLLNVVYLDVVLIIFFRNMFFRFIIMLRGGFNIQIIIVKQGSQQIYIVINKIKFILIVQNNILEKLIDKKIMLMRFIIVINIIL